MKFLVQNQPCYAYTGGKEFDPSRRSIVFVHGAANDHSVWQLQARYFAHHGWNALAIDLPGHGRSFGSAKSSIEANAEWLAAFLDNALIANAVLVGHSMGSLIALESARRFPEKVSHLALLGASLPMPVAGALLTAARDTPSEAFDLLNLWGHGPNARLGASPIPGMVLTGGYQRLLERSAPGVLHTDLAACQAYAPDPATLAQVQCPALILIGSRDQMTPPKAGHALAELLPSSRTMLIEGCGHALTTEAPGAVLVALAEFVGG